MRDQLVKLNDRALARGSEQGRFSGSIGALVHQGFGATFGDILRRTSIGGPKSHRQNKRVRNVGR